MNVPTQSTQRPLSLQKGDQIGLISTARKINEEELEYAKSLFSSWGLNVVFGDHLFRKFHQFAGTDTQRAADLQSMIDDPDIKAMSLFFSVKFISLKIRLSFL